MVLRDPNDPLNQSRGIMGPLQNTNVQNNRGRLRQRFDLIRKLGQGTYGKVQLGIDKETGQEVAIKTIKKSKIETEADLIRIRREIQIMSSVRHPNIIHIYEVFENREKMVLVMEYAAGGELYDYLNERKVLQEDEARRIFRQIASAVYYCHKHKICHRDLKLENILLDERWNAKIADFGLSNVFDDLNSLNMLKTFCGSPLYASPEIVRGTPYCGPEVDCWSLGVLLYTLVYGAMPFDGSNFKRLVKQISQGDYYEPKKPAEASRLIKCMLTVDPLKRATIKDVCAHPWINKGFDKQCLATAEELANQTPVRLDVLLSVAPQHSINHSQVLIPAVGAEGPSDEIPSTSDALTTTTAPTQPAIKKPYSKAQEPPKPTAAVAPFEKPARSSIKPPQQQQPPAIPGPSSSTPAPKPTVKVKQPSVKKKSKSSPLLDLIAVVEEADKEKLEDIMDVGCDDEDAGDTLSEISEIQTIAEDAKEVPKEPAVLPKSATPGPPQAKKPKEAAEVAPAPAPQPAPPEQATEPKKKVVKPKAKEPTKQQEPPKDSTVTVPPQPKAVKPVQTQKQDEPQPLPLPTEDDVLKKAAKPKEPSPEKPKTEVANEVAPAPPPETKVPAKTPGPIKKKLVKQKTVDKSAEVKDEGTSKPLAGGSGTTSANGSSSSVASSGSRTGIKDSKASRLRNRSDSNSSVDASPTRIERRNSKVISQKTAELIQNLETKTSTSNDAGKPKKLVFPSLKVSDAKRAFEKPPKPATTSGSSPPKPSEESTKPPPRTKKLLPQKSTEEPKPAVKEDKLVAPKLKKPKSKSPSPAPPPVPEPNKPDETSEALPPSSVTLEPEPAKPKKQKSPSPKPNPVPSPEPVSEEPTTTTTTEATTATKTKPVLSKLKMQASPEQPKSVVVDSVKGPSKSEPEPQQDQKKEAVKKISSVISRIASSESADRIMLEGQEKKPKTVKTQIETFVNSPEPSKPIKMQRSEVSFPVAAAPVVTPSTPSTPAIERIIPIQFENGLNPSTPPTPAATATQQHHAHPLDTSSSKTQSAPNIMSRAQAIPKRMESTSTIYSRQNSSDTESSASAMPPQRLEHIKKSPREFIIPIKLEGSGQTLTPKESDPAESSLAEDPFRMDSRLRSGRFGRHKRYSSLLSDSSLDEEPSVSMSASACSTRRGSSVAPSVPSHARSHSQGDEPENPSAPLNTKHRRSRRPTATTLDRSDSFSSAEEDDEDAFEVLTAESLFSSLLDRVRNLTKRINREDGTPWPMAESPGLGLWNAHPMTSFMPSSSRAPSESRSSFVSSVPASSGSYTMTRSYSREPSVSVTITSGPGWRRSLSSDMSGDSDSASAISETHSSTHAMPSAGISTSTTRMPPREDATTDSVLSRIQQRRTPFSTQRSEPFGSSSSASPMTTSAYGSSPSSRTYGRTLSNNEYATSVTLPFRRSFTKSYDRPSSYDHNAPSSSATTTSGISGLGSWEPSTSSASHYTGSSSIPHRSSSVLNTRYSPSTTTSSLDPSSYGSSRYTRSLSRPRTSVLNDSDGHHRLHRDFSIPRYTSGSSAGEANGHASTSSASSASSARHSGESNGWVGGSNSSSVVTKSAAVEMNAKTGAQTVPTNGVSETNGHGEPSLVKEQRAPSASRSLFGFVPTPTSTSAAKPKAASRTELSTRAKSEAPTLLPVSLGSIPSPAVGTIITIPASSSRTEISKTNRTSRATSVEKITRLLERKSMPRERSVVSPPPTARQISSPPPLPPSDGKESPVLNGESHVTNGDSKPGASETSNKSKLSKPKFIQSLEKKWERLKSPAPSPVPPSEETVNLIDQTAGSDDSTSIDGPKPDSESVFLQRAVSPEKKPKSKFGSSTVNYMLGKFRKFEETSSTPAAPTAVVASTSTKPPSAAGSRIGRRVQSAYAGAVSDSVLALPQSCDMASSTDPSEHRKSPLKSFLKNRKVSTELEENGRPLSLGSSYAQRNSVEPEDFSASLVSSGIPRSKTVSETSSSRRPPPPLPSINISAAQNYGREQQYDNDDNSIMTPSSMTDSLDSASICSEKTELTRSILDDEESVSDRILRKSFYSRFNSLDRKQRSSSVHSGMPRKSSMSTSPSAKTSTARSSLSPGNTPRLFHHSNSVDDDFANGGASASFARDPSPSLTKANLECLDEEYYFDPTGINKYNPNPLFKELITDEFKSDVGKKTEYSRRVTNKLSKLLREIESDIGANNNSSSSSNHGNHSNRRSSATATMKATSYLPKPVKSSKSPSVAHENGRGNGGF